MNNDNRTLLTILEACTLLARETVSMLDKIIFFHAPCFTFPFLYSLVP